MFWKSISNNNIVQSNVTSVGKADAVVNFGTTFCFYGFMPFGFAWELNHLVDLETFSTGLAVDENVSGVFLGTSSGASGSLNYVAEKSVSTFFTYGAVNSCVEV